MKKLLTIAFCAAAAAVMADSTEVICGTNAVLVFTCPAGVTQNVMAVAFDGLDQTGGVSVSNLVQTVNLAENDELYIYSGSQYSGYKLAKNGSVKYWQELTANYTVNGTSIQTAAGTSADTTDLVAGKGFWLVRKSNVDKEITVAVYGKPVDASVQLTANARNLCGNPTGSSKTPNITSPTAKDKILVPSSESMEYDTYVYNGTKWMKASQSSISEANPSVPGMAGFWYITAAGSTPTITWPKD